MGVPIVVFNFDGDDMVLLEDMVHRMYVDGMQRDPFGELYGFTSKTDSEMEGYRKEHGMYILSRSDYVKYILPTMDEDGPKHVGATGLLRSNGVGVFRNEELGVEPIRAVIIQDRAARLEDQIYYVTAPLVAITKSRLTDD